MTAPKHIPLPKRWSDAALERLAAWLITPLEAADDAHVLPEDEPECMCRPHPAAPVLLTYDCTIHGEAEPDDTRNA